MEILDQLLFGHLQRGQLRAALQLVFKVFSAKLINILRLIPQDFANEILEDARELSGDLMIRLILG